MNRRDFLSRVLAAGAASVLPPGVVSLPEQWQNGTVAAGLVDSEGRIVAAKRVPWEAAENGIRVAGGLPVTFYPSEILPGTRRIVHAFTRLEGVSEGITAYGEEWRGECVSLSYPDGYMLDVNPRGGGFTDAAMPAIVDGIAALLRPNRN